jgi:hypothetical protein
VFSRVHQAPVSALNLILASPMAHRLTVSSSPLDRGDGRYHHAGGREAPSPKALLAFNLIPGVSMLWHTTY